LALPLFQFFLTQLPRSPPLTHNFDLITKAKPPSKSLSTFTQL